MLAAISAILGFLTSLGPSIVGYFSQKESNAQQLRLAQLQLEATRQGHAAELAIANAQADVQQQQSLYAYDAGSTGNKFVDAFRGIVRPYITMVLFHMWLAIEIALLLYGIARGMDLAQLVTIVWSQETAALFAAVIAFWFGQRAVKYGMAAALAPPLAPVVVTPSAKKAAPHPTAEAAPAFPDRHAPA